MSYIYTNKGCYQVGNKNFYNKLEACLAIDQLPDQTHHLHWNFHDTIFSQYCWDVEPPVDILTLYRERAQQLRDNYDPLVLFYSGGADSHTVLQSFINNNIHLDEVFLFGAFEAEKQRAAELGLDREPGYYTREVHYLVEPRLRELQKKHHFRITKWDWTNRTLKLLENPDWIWQVGTRFSPDTVARQCLHDIARHTDRYEDKGKRTAFIFGVDKPRLLRDDHNAYLAFLDVMLTTGAGNHNDIVGKHWENDEYFYWTPNMPQIAIKQSHLILKYLKSTGMTSILPIVGHAGSFQMMEYYQLIHPVIYPNWDTNTWQIKKSKSVVRDEFSQWFFDFAPDRSQQQWKSGIDQISRSINPRFFNDNDVWKGLVVNFSKHYRIGTI